MSQRPNLVVGVVDYPNPFPHADTAAAMASLLCVQLIDTIPGCLTRWLLLPPALALIDQVFQKLNSTLKASLGPFNQGPSGNRWVFDDVYPLMKDHCMKMDVTIKTTVVHPEEDGVTHEHDSGPVSFGCDTPWFTAGSDGTDSPFLYLQPAVTGSAHRRLADDERDGRLPELGRPEVHRRLDLGGRHDRSGHDAAQVEARVRRGVQLEHLPVTGETPGERTVQ